jgi:hypothetical protein
MPTAIADSQPMLLAQHNPAARRHLVPPGRDRQFVALQGAYRHCGGLTRGESLAQRMGAAGRGGYLELAARIVAGQVFSFRWHQDFWLPLFQFHPERFEPLEAPRRVTAELRGVMDGWAVASWYVTPLLALDGETPLAVLDIDLPAVLTAARAAHVA